ncbi:MAG: hypothetical protein ACHQQQ_03300 [Bacteroidota bacterium]
MASVIFALFMGPILLVIHVLQPVIQPILWFAGVIPGWLWVTIILFFLFGKLTIGIIGSLYYGIKDIIDYFR